MLTADNLDAGSKNGRLQLLLCGAQALCAHNVLDVDRVHLLLRLLVHKELEGLVDHRLARLRRHERRVGRERERKKKRRGKERGLLTSQGRGKGERKEFGRTGKKERTKERKKKRKKNRNRLDHSCFCVL